MQELQQQAAAFRDLDRRVADGGWVVESRDLRPRANAAADVELDVDGEGGGGDDDDDDDDDKIPTQWMRSE